MVSNKKLCLCILLSLCFIFPINADTIHNISFTDNLVIVNSTLILKSEEKIDYWSLRLDLPNNSKIIDLNDELNKIDYNFSNSKLSFKTNKKRAKSRIVNLVFSKELEEKYGLKTINLNLFGFENDTTIVISQNVSYFFAPNSKTEYGEIIKAKKQGSINVKMIFGGNTESKHYFTNSNLNLSSLEKYLWVIEGITGIKVPVKFGIVLLTDKKYNLELENWSAGTYRGGLIFIRNSLSKPDKTATILHETTHGFNSFALDWDNTNISWFDEGVACYVTTIMYRLLNETRPEIFGEKIKWKEKRVIYTLESQYAPEDLFNYYKNENWVLEWYPRKYSKYKREFGYAYSELFIREYLSENCSNLHKVYAMLLKINKSVENPGERNKLITKILGKEFKPCYSKNLEEIKNCTAKLNKMSFRIPKIEGTSINYKIEVPKLPEIEEESYFKLFLETIERFFNEITKYFQSLFQK